MAIFYDSRTFRAIRLDYLMPETQVLFLHHLDGRNDAVVEANYNSFLNCGNDILGIRDEDVRGLPGSFPVTVSGRIPRGSRRWATDTVLLNYVLEQKDSLKHKRYMFCEYDCLCECNLDIYCEEYGEFDICAPYLVTKKSEAGWGWFHSIDLPCEPLGLRPSTFILFSKDALVATAEKYESIWDRIKDSNSEARLGSVANLLGLKVGQFRDLVFNVSWGPTKFDRNGKLYHPVKDIVSGATFIPLHKTSELSGVWEFGRTNGPRLGVLILQTDGTIANYDNYNEVYWREEGDTLSLYSGRGGLTSRFHDVKSDGDICVGDHYDGNLAGEKVILEGHHWVRRVQI